MDDKGKETVKYHMLISIGKQCNSTYNEKIKTDGGWGIEAKDRVLLVYPPSLDFIAAYKPVYVPALLLYQYFHHILVNYEKILHSVIHESSGATVALTNNMYSFAKKASESKQFSQKIKKSGRMLSGY